MEETKISTKKIIGINLLIAFLGPIVLALGTRAMTAIISSQNEFLFMLVGYGLLLIVVLWQNISGFRASQDKGYLVGIFIYLLLGMGSCFFSGLFLSGMRIAG